MKLLVYASIILWLKECGALKMGIEANKYYHLLPRKDELPFELLE